MKLKSVGPNFKESGRYDHCRWNNFISCTDRSVTKFNSQLH